MSFYQQDNITGQLYRIDIENGEFVKYPVDVLPDNLVTPSGARAMTPSELIGMADKRTERRGKNLDLKQELLTVCQEFCQEHRWHWRKRSIAFPSIPGQSTYDLSAQNGMGGLTCERVCGGYARNRWQGPKIFRSANDYGDLTPIFETEDQEIARESDNHSMPAQYFMDGQDQFRLVSIPDGVYEVRVPMWVMPDMTPMDDSIRLVPGYLHHILLKGLECHIYEANLGEGNAKYMAARAEYDRMVLRASLNTDFADGRVREWKTDEEAIQST